MDLRCKPAKPEPSDGGFAPTKPANPEQSDGGFAPTKPENPEQSDGGFAPTKPANPEQSDGGFAPTKPANPEQSDGGFAPTKPANPEQSDGGFAPTRAANPKQNDGGFAPTRPTCTAVAGPHSPPHFYQARGGPGEQAHPKQQCRSALVWGSTALMSARPRPDLEQVLFAFCHSTRSVFVVLLPIHLHNRG